MQGDPEAVKLIANLTDVQLPDGIASLDCDPGAVLLADAHKAVIWRVDTTTGMHTVAIDSPLFQEGALPLGVDGIHILNNELYFTNLATSLLGKATLTAEGSVKGSIQNLSTSATLGDDFCLAEDGTAYVAGDNTLWRVRPDGATDAIVGGANSTVLQGVTSAQFGRTKRDRDVVYMGTQGGLLFLPPGGDIHGGQLLAVNVGLFD